MTDRRIKQRDDLIRRLAEQVDELTERVTQLKETLVPPKPMPAVLKLSASEETMLKAIYARSPNPIDTKGLMAALYGFEAREEDANTIGVFMSKLRKKLAPFVMAAVYWPSHSASVAQRGTS